MSVHSRVGNTADAKKSMDGIGGVQGRDKLQLQSELRRNGGDCCFPPDVGDIRSLHAMRFGD